MRSLKGRVRGSVVFPLLVGFVSGLIICLLLIAMVHLTSRSSFCLSCHEMTSAGKEWRISAHYANSKGIVVQCRDCHIKPGWAELMKVNFTLGSKDLIVHLFQRPKVTEELRERWREHARSEISDDSCRRCHNSLIPPGIGMGGIIAHMSYERNREKLGLNCVKCHYHKFHGPKPAYGTL